MSLFPELEQVRVHVDPDTRDKHLQAIARELRRPVHRPGRRFRLLAVAVVVVMLLPVIALAAERTHPGDLLYPIRQLIQGADPVAEVDEIYFSSDGATDAPGREAPGSDVATSPGEGDTPTPEPDRGADGVSPPVEERGFQRPTDRATSTTIEGGAHPDRPETRDSRGDPPEAETDTTRDRESGDEGGSGDR